MKPAKFEYFKPESLKQALTMLEQFGEDAKIISGGQSLIPVMNMRLSKPKVLIDINRIAELSYIKETDSGIQIGALTRHYEIESSDTIRRCCPMLSEGIQLVGHPQIRSRGTIGGSLVHADPTAELPVILSVLGGSVTVASTNGTRVIEPDELFLTYLTTSIQSDELLVSVQLPGMKNRSGHSIEEFTYRKGDFAIVIAAAVVTLSDSNEIEELRLCLGGVDGVPVLLDEVANSLIGEQPDELRVHEVCQQIRELIDPEEDTHANSEFRRDLSVELSKKVIFQAIQRATGVIR